MSQSPTPHRVMEMDYLHLEDAPSGCLSTALQGILVLSPTLSLTTRFLLMQLLSKSIETSIRLPCFQPFCDASGINTNKSDIKIVFDKLVQINLTGVLLFYLDFSKRTNWDNIELSMDNASFPVKRRHKCSI